MAQERGRGGEGRDRHESRALAEASPILALSPRMDAEFRRHEQPLLTLERRPSRRDVSQHCAFLLLQHREIE